MNPFDTNNEQHLREQILGHEFPFEEQAWQDMEALLKRKKDDALLAGLPESDVAATPGAVSKASKWVLIAGLVLIVALFIRLTRNDAAPATQQTPFVPFENAKPLETSGKEPIASTPISNNEPVAKAENDTQTAKPTFKTQLENASATTLKGKSQQKDEALKNPGLTENHKNVENEVLVTPALKTENNSALEKGDPGSYGTNKTVVQGGNVVHSDVSSVAETISEKRIETLNFLPQASDHVSFAQAVSPALPNIILPADRPRKHGFSTGYLLGAQTTVVDYNKLKVAVGPHLGAFLRFQLSPRNSIQAELTAKWVKGYKLQASQQYSNFDALGNVKTSAYSFNASRLGFVELPLLFRRQTDHARFAWLAGVRPALILPFGTTNYDGKGYNGPTFAGEVIAQKQSFFSNKIDGLRKFDLGLVAGVEWQLSRNLFLDVRYTQGLYDLSYDNFFGNNDYHLNSDIQVSLRRFFGARR